MTAVEDLAVLPRCEDQITILQQDPAFLVINKPARLLSVPGRHPLNNDSVISRLHVEFPAAAIVHRLDFDTSGVMVVPLSKAALSHISKQFQARSLSKRYIAVVAGLVEKDSGIIDLPIAADPNNRPRYKICFAQGKPSITEFSVIERDVKNQTTRLFLHPITGRSHQLRLHLQALGHAILGCEFYASDAIKNASSRLLLHAAELIFTHPETAQPVIASSVPDF